MPFRSLADVSLSCRGMAVLLCLAGALCGPSGLRSTFAEEVSLAADFGEPHVIIPAPDDGSIAHVSWPKVVRTPEGTLVVAAIAGEFHGSHGGGCPVTAYSTDGGRTFSEMQVLKRYGPQMEYTSAGNCALGVAEDGAVVLLSMAYNGDASSTIDGWRSTDAGRTWIPTDVSRLDRSQTGSVYGHVIHVPQQGLAVFGHYRKPQNTENGGLWMAWSRDQGRSWDAPQRIELETKLRLVEPAVDYSRGKFVGLIRHGGDNYLEITSEDRGSTWTSKLPVLKSDHPGKVMLPSPCIVSDPQHAGRLLALVSERHGRDATNPLLGRLTLWECQDTTRDWRKLGDVVHFPTTLGRRTDITYGWMAPLGNDQWYVVFYCGQTRGPSDIYGMTITLPMGRGQ